jgi:hypothetical protein
MVGVKHLHNGENWVGRSRRPFHLTYKNSTEETERDR